MGVVIVGRSVCCSCLVVVRIAQGGSDWSVEKLGGSCGNAFLMKGLEHDDFHA